MKYTCIAILLMGTLATVMAAFNKEAFKEVFTKCKEDEKVDDAVVADIKATHELNSDGAKRLWRCIYAVRGIMKDDKFDKDGFVKLSEEVHEGDDDKDAHVATAKEIAETCDGTVGAGGATPEDTAKMIHDCVMAEAHKRGVSPLGKPKKA